MRILVSVSTLLLFSLVSAYAGDNMKAFPPPAKGQTRYVLHLPELDNESNCRVELIVGKTVKLDEANRYFFGGSIKKETIAGWGFRRYVVNELGPMAGTLMAVDPDAPRVDRFIRLSGEPYLVRYNSRLPVVVYVPDGVDLHYRMWRADPKERVGEEG